MSGFAPALSTGALAPLRNDAGWKWRERTAGLPTPISLR
jgi:hypothetical protein